MGIISSLWEKRDLPFDDPRTWSPFVGWWQTATGVDVNQESAMRATVVFACIRIIAETVGSLPLPVYERKGDNKVKAYNHWLYPLLHDLPNPLMTAMTFRETMTHHLAAYGNCYAEIQRDSGGRPIALWPIAPNRVTFKITPEYKRYYEVKVGAETVTLLDKQVFHLPGFGLTGTTGYSPIYQASEAIGLAMAAEEYDARFYGNDATPSFALTHPETLSDEAYRRLKESFDKTHKGLKKAHRYELLEEGMKIETIGISHEAAQFIETRRLQVEEIARMWRVPLSELTTALGQPAANVEQEDIKLEKHCIRPYLVRWEQGITKDLLEGQDRQRYFAEHNVEGLRRGDIQTRYMGYNLALAMGWMSRNDVRRIENMDPIPDGMGGDLYLGPMNYGPLTMLGQPQGPVATRMEEMLPELRPVIDRAERARFQPESRSRKSDAESRLYIARSFEDVFKDSTKRLVKRETQDLLRAAKKLDTAGFGAFVNDYYRDHRPIVRQFLDPAFTSLAKSIQAAAAKEVGGYVGMTRALNECLDYHVERVSERHCNAATSAIFRLLSGEGRAVQPKKGLLEMLEDELGAWYEDVPETMATWETIRTTGLISKATYFFNDVRQIQWITTDNNPYCPSLDEVTIDLGDRCDGGIFADKGGEIEGRSNVLTPAWNVTTPPLFKGCTCMIVGMK